MNPQLIPEEPTAHTPSEITADTPMMVQYRAVKAQYPDCLLFYRMGDFYEMFFDDAVTAAAVLDITLTKRGEVPMCGVPWHSHENYLARLIRRGHKVALCEQVETPEQAKKRGGYKALVTRDVIRVVTQGTLTEETLLEKSTHNYLAAVAECGAESRVELGMAWLDVSTGEFTLQSVSVNDLAATLERVNAGEILIAEKLVQNPVYADIFSEHKSKWSLQPHSRFDSENARKRLEKLFGVATLESFGEFSRAEITAAGALLDYIDLTQKGKMPHLCVPRKIPTGSVMDIDAATRRNLELTHTMGGARQGSLLHAVDHTVTGAGARLLSNHLTMPLTDIQVINTRLDMVTFFVERASLRADTQKFLQGCADIERSLARLSVGRGGPRDLAAIRHTLAQTVQLYRRILNEGAETLPQGIKDALESLKLWGSHHPVIDLLECALTEEVPALAREGGFIKKGYAPRLDELKFLRDESRLHIAQLQSKYVQISGVATLKIKQNNVIGFFIEVSTAQADKLFAKTGDFIHRQTMLNAARFTTTELAELERKISESAEKALALELELFEFLVKEVLLEGKNITAAAESLAALDVASSLAELAVKNNLTRPLVDDSLAFEIKGGRHLVVETALKKGNVNFIANDCALADATKVWLLTGPNMAGKSTFLRQNALIALLAQMGCYVPAAFAHIGIVDKLFSRVGAADDLARGRSTFMVEMVETATILHQATARSLVILDEIGRGTATYDGLSIAWACLEYLHDVNQCRALFATHYHELTELSAKLAHLSCYTMRVQEWKDSIIFLHEIAAGSADRSYGVHVAKLAGLPPAVINRAQAVLKMLENTPKAKTIMTELPLFSAMAPPPVVQKSAVESALALLHPDSLSPKDALEKLYELQALLKMSQK